MPIKSSLRLPGRSIFAKCRRPDGPSVRAVLGVAFQRRVLGRSALDASLSGAVGLDIGSS